MVIMEKRVCDVFGTTKGVDQYCVKVYRVGVDPEGLRERFAEQVDLSPRGLIRLDKFIRRGMTAPSSSESTAEEGGD